jgi:probable rRNA maturation factor
MRSRIYFFSEDLKFSPPAIRKTRVWLKQVAAAENKSLDELTYIFCSDSYLLGINIEYLGHDMLTDIITFNTAENEAGISGDVFISVERVAENAAKFKVSFAEELHRVMVHGLLHLLGYDDKSTQQKKIMREKEFAYLSLRDF